MRDISDCRKAGDLGPYENKLKKKKEKKNLDTRLQILDYIMREVNPVYGYWVTGRVEKQMVLFVNFLLLMWLIMALSFRLG